MIIVPADQSPLRFRRIEVQTSNSPSRAGIRALRNDSGTTDKDSNRESADPGSAVSQSSTVIEGLRLTERDSIATSCAAAYAEKESIRQLCFVKQKRFVVIISLHLRFQRPRFCLIFAMFIAFVQQSAFGQEANQLFPDELVKFQPIEANPLFQGRGPGFWDERIRERGWIMREGDNWFMWYTGVEGGGGSDGPDLKLGYATSTDGLHWQRYQDAPIYSEKWVEDMLVVKESGTYYMFAEGKFDIAQLLTSTDRIHWTNQGPLDIRLSNGAPISEGPRGTPAAYFEDGTWYLFYERRDLGVWLATSTDTKIWTNASDDPVIPLGPGAYDNRQIAMNQIIKYNGIYYGYFHGSSHDQPKLWSTNVAASKDLMHWTKYPGNPLVPLEENKSSGILVYDGKQFRLYTMHNQVHVHFPVTSPAQ